MIIFFAGYRHIVQTRKGVRVRYIAWVASFRLWWRDAWDSLRRRSQNSFYIVCGLLILVSGGLALYTGLWPTGWSQSFSSLYVFETAAAWSFGAAWIVASFEHPIIIQEQVAAVTERKYEGKYGAEDHRTLTAKANLEAIRAAGIALGVIADPAPAQQPETPPVAPPPPDAAT